ncbi:MAG: hypothetical protein LBB81_00820 [Treponema sp.]|jgi:hypothetical protein|nr:hypothetical protein [Treponema sp.]
MGKKSFTQEKSKNKDDLQDLMKEANKAGILHISAHGRGVSKQILKDAIETSNTVKKYFSGNP